MTCCDELLGEVVALRAQIEALKTDLGALEERAANKGADKAKTALLPQIANALTTALGAKAVAGQAATVAGTAVRIGTSAAERAAAAWGVASAAQGAASAATAVGNSALARANAAWGSAGIANSTATAANGAAATAAAAAARVLAIVLGLVATVAGVVAGLAALKISMARIDFVERGLGLLGDQVSGILGKLLGMNGRISHAQTTADIATAAAKNAQFTGDSAYSAAQDAKNAAKNAQVTALDAQTMAQNAQATAQGAQTTAQGAQTTAQGAQLTAQGAQTTAQGAQSTASNAERIAIEALNTARNSSKGLSNAPIINNYYQTNNNVYPIRDRIKEIQTNTIQTKVETKEIVREIKTNTIQTVILGKITEVPINFAPFTAALNRSNQLAAQSLSNAQTAAANAAAASSAANNAAQKAQQAQQSVGKLSDTVQDKFKKLSKRLKLPEIMNALTLIVVLHNAAMISRSLVETLGLIVDNALAIIGLKDEDGQPYSIGDELGKSATSFMVSILGQQVWNDAVESWQSANRTYQSGANVVWTFTGLIDSVRSVAEYTASNVGFIGNALKRNGVVEENAYPAMDENPTAYSSTRRKLERAIEGLENADSSASAIAGVTGEVRSAQSEVQELREARQEFQQNLSATKSQLEQLEQGTKTAATVGTDPTDADLQP